MNDNPNPYTTPRVETAPTTIEVSGGGESPENEKIHPYGFWLTTLFALIVIVAWGVLQTVVLLAYVQVTGGEFTPAAVEALALNGFFLGVVTVSTAPAAIAFTLFFVSMRGVSTRDYLALRPVSLKTIALWCAIGIAAAVGADYVKYFFGFPVVSTFIEESYRTAGSMALFTTAIVIMAPLWEEILFRGFVFAGYSRSPIGPIGAILIPALIWAAIHLQYEAHDIATIFVLGIVIGVARWRTNSLYVPIAIHLVLNSIALISVAISIDG
ncbi:MAG: type II CAAX endopeptidase family protein [Leptospirales bacterium]|jgi:membrane protease YdiL (CAAX protease family)